MKRRVALPLFAVVAAVGLYVGPTQAATTTLVVDDDAATGTCKAGEPEFTTIQEAVEAAALAAPGTRIHIRVCPGTYNETVKVETPNLTIEGAKAGKDARSRSGAGSGESVVTGGGSPAAVQLLEDNITWDGFVVTGNTGGSGLYTSPNFSGYDVRNTVFSGNASGLYLHSKGARQTTVRANRFTANNAGPAGGNGIYSDQGARRVLIATNRFESHASAGIHFAGSVPSGGEASVVRDRLTIVQNQSTDDSSFVALWASSHVTVTGNRISNSRVGTGSAIVLGAGNDHVVVRDNQIRSAGVSGIDASDAVLGDATTPSRHVAIVGNSVRKASLNGIDVTATGPGQYEVRGNSARDNAGVGIHFGLATNGNLVADNTALDNDVDCQDESKVGDTEEPANLWRNNIGVIADPGGICRQHRERH
jgi:parallel beta-helix repeat protein